jgi:uncharacterized protein (DUF2252 family)
MRERPSSIAGRGAFWSCAALWLVAGCALESDAPRASWLRHTLILDNQPFLDREYELTKGKFALMADDLYRFARGTSGQYARDTMAPGGAARMPSAYLSASTHRVAIIGDPHPENIGTYRRGDGQLTLEFNDFDAAAYGPYTFDLRRLNLGLALAAEQVNRELEARGQDAAFSEVATRRLVEAAARAYAQEIERIAEGAPRGPVFADQSWGAIADELFAEAGRRGDERHRLSTYSRLEGEARELVIGHLEPPRYVELGGRRQLVYEATIEAVSDAEARRILAQLEPYAASLVDATRASPQLFERVDVGRRLGVGVSSYPNRRYYVLLGGAAREDAVLLDWKEVIDTVELVGLELFPSRAHASNGERLAARQRALHASRDSDPWLGFVTSGGESFRVAERTGYQRSFSVRRLARDLERGEVTAADFEVFARLAGQILARSHAETPALDGARPAAALAAAIGGDGDGLAAETAEFVAAYAPIVMQDYELFRELIAEHGFDLGYRRP